MSMHKQMIGKIGPGSVANDVTLADYIARKTKEPLTFEQWFEQVWDPAKIVSPEGEEILRACWKAAQENM